jgi:hypothetical protein
LRLMEAIQADFLDHFRRKSPRALETHFIEGSSLDLKY